METNKEYWIQNAFFKKCFFKKVHKCFRMKTFWSIPEAVSLRPHDFMACTDLTEAYLHIHMLPSYHTFLRFAYNSHFQFRALSFRLAAASRAFSKIMVALLTLLHCKGIHTHLYLDNLLIRSPNLEQTCKDNTSTIQCPMSHMIFPYLTKSEWNSTKQIEHLEVLIDSPRNKLYSTVQSILFIVA